MHGHLQHFAILAAHDERQHGARLQAAHATLLTLGLECTLDRRARRVPFGDTVDAARSVVRDVAHAKGLAFDAG